MRDVFDAMPIVQALRAMKRDLAAVVLLAAIALYAGIALALPSTPSLQQRIMRQHHFQPASYAEWVVLQPLPKMYGMSHQVWIGHALPSEAAFTATAWRANHYPARFLRFDGRRAEFAERVGAQRARLRSRYRGESFVSDWRIYRRESRIVLEPIEAWR